MATIRPSSSSSPHADSPHTIRVEFVVSGVVIGLALAGLAFLSFAYWRAAHDSAKVQSIDTLHAQQQAIAEGLDRLKVQTEVLKSQNDRSIEDRDQLHESQGAVRESLARVEQSTAYLKAAVETAVAKDQARQKTRADEAAKKK